MINRCRVCGCVCPDFSTHCDTCYRALREDAWLTDEDIAFLNDEGYEDYEETTD